MTTLKEYTQELHDKIEQTPFSKKFLAGELSEDQWNMLLVQKSAIYDAIESRRDLPSIAKCAHRLRMDCLGLDYALMPTTQRYVEHIQKLLPPQLVDAHVYVHYLGDMYGGQMLKKLAPNTERTTHLEFEDRVATIKAVREIIDHRANELADEAIAGFKFMMEIQNEIFQCTNPSQ